MQPKKLLLIFGTRPEAIKMAPLVKTLKANKAFDARVCVTAQHRQMLDQVLALFDIQPEFDLNLMKPGQDLTDITCGVLTGLKQVFKNGSPTSYCCMVTRQRRWAPRWRAFTMAYLWRI